MFSEPRFASGGVPSGGVPSGAVPSGGVPSGGVPSRYPSTHVVAHIYDQSSNFLFLLFGPSRDSSKHTQIY